MPKAVSRRAKIQEIEQGIAKLEARRAVFGDTVTDIALAPLREQLALLHAEQPIVVEEHIEQLESSGLIRVAAVDPELEYLFRHALVQDAAYDSMLKQDRRELHLRVAAALEQAYPHRREALAAALAHHYSEAEEWQHALGHWRLAAETALARYANPEAEANYRAALAIIHDQRGSLPDGLVRLLEGLGEAVMRQGKHQEAITIWREAIALFREAGDLNCAAHLYARSGRAAYHDGDNNLNLAIALDGLEALEDASASVGMAALLHEAGRAFLFVGQMEKGYPFVLRAIRMAEQMRSGEVLAHALTTQGAFVTLAPAERMRILQQAIDLAESETFLDAAARAHYNMGTLLMYTVNAPDKALPHRYRAAELARLMGATAQYARQLLSALNVSLTLGDTRAVREGMIPLNQAVLEAGMPRGMLEGFEASVLAQEGYLSEACEMIEELLVTHAAATNIDLLGSVLRVLYFAKIELGEYSDAERWLPDVIEATRPLSTKTLLPLLEARLRTSQRQIEASERLLQEAGLLYKAQPNPFDGMFLALESARLAAAKQDCDAALAGFERLTAVELSKYRAEYAYILRQIADVYLRRGADGDHERGIDRLRQAREIYASMPAPAWVARVDATLTSIS